MGKVGRMSDSQVAEEFEIVTVQSGVRSLRALSNGETFHPVVGPMAEAVGLHVRQQQLVERAGQTDGPFVIWDVGLGAAANAVAVLEAFLGRGPGEEIRGQRSEVRDLSITSTVELHSFDRTTGPLDFALRHADTLEYLAPHTDAVQTLLNEGSWEVGTGEFRWQFHAGDFRETMEVAPAPHAVLYDPYSPVTNPDLWTLEHFTALRARLSPERPCLLTNYTRSTAVRVTLMLAGFFVGIGHATGEKDQTTVATNDLSLLDDPLGEDWLGRVERSTRSAPQRAGEPWNRPISAEDLERLRKHPQFER